MFKTVLFVFSLGGPLHRTGDQRRGKQDRSADKHFARFFTECIDPADNSDQGSLKSSLSIRF
jgi:hypothetical protein